MDKIICSMLENFKNKFLFDKFLQDCNQYKVQKQTYDVSYFEFLEYFKNVEIISKHHLIISINFTYGWMPTIFDFRSDKFDEAIIILNDAKNGIIPTVKQLEILKCLFNNSLVGTSKLLHFIDPEIFAILDSRVYRYITGKEPYNHRIGSCEAYLSFLAFFEYLTTQKVYEEVHDLICQKFGKSMTKYRTAELIMYLNGGKENKTNSI